MMHWFGRRTDGDHRAEFEAHIDGETQANVDRGMPLDEARRAARAAFGSVASVRQQLHEGRRGYWLSAIGQDIRYAGRMILKHRLLSCIVVLTMSVGIGCTTAVFSLLNAIIFAPPVASDPDSFLQIVRAAGSPQTPVADAARYETLRTESRSLRELAAWSSHVASAPLGGDNEPPADGVLASCNIFQVIAGTPALAGRLLQPSDCDDRLPVAVISERAWRRRFAGDPGVVGRSITYGRHVVTIVGVAPELRSHVEVAHMALWLPYTLRPQLQDLFELRAGADSCEPAESVACKAYMVERALWLELAGRLAPGASRSTAAAELKVMTSREAVDPEAAVRLKVTDGSLWSTGPPDVGATLALILLLPTVIALIVCTNVASLLLSRAVKRQQEMAIRLAVGGGRLTLVRMLLVEQVLLAGAAAVLSLWLVMALPPILEARIPGLSEQLLHGTGPDWTVLAYLAAMALLTAIGAVTMPALESLNVRIVDSLKGRQALGASRGLSRPQAVLICAQVVLSMVPLVGTAALLRAERRVSHPGFDAGQVVVASVFRDRQSGSALEWPTERVQSLPAVRSTALATSFPPFVDRMIAVQGPDLTLREFPVLSVSPDYFRTLGIALTAGRPLRDGDALRGDGDRAVIVSSTLARRLFPGQDPVGRSFDAPADHTRLEIVGIASDALTFTDGSRFTSDRSLMYEILDRKPDQSGRPADPVLIVRFAGDPRQFATDLQSVLTPMRMRVAVDTIQSILDENLAFLQLIRTLVMATAGVGLALALIGVFGVLAFAAAQRRKEVAIRAAVGASRADIFAAIIRPALWPTGLGIAIGAVVSFGVLRFFESVSRVTSASADPGAYVAGACLLLGAALAAMSSPAWRAATADPSRALRED